MPVSLSLLGDASVDGLASTTRTSSALGGRSPTSSGLPLSGGGEGLRPPTSSILRNLISETKGKDTVQPPSSPAGARATQRNTLDSVSNEAEAAFYHNESAPAPSVWSTWRAGISKSVDPTFSRLK
ncbi:hypothetical protein THAOC_00877 [Thalassiosira oceanica]|uniref:Uncharacterized protein n=1 Tax=Thalassiosira oceanica TaxID=159749 RepID=K0TEZ8_THAOC|nr:hypothetical protein THAOC_00877 [Thalassiosira oceanica]|eukprot:EJK77298.1 hypothetical protein THAOC_00877 [Thalassiosira oceanica]